jgi:hypothetical protein
VHKAEAAAGGEPEPQPLAELGEQVVAGLDVQQRGEFVTAPRPRKLVCSSTSSATYGLPDDTRYSHLTTTLAAARVGGKCLVRSQPFPVWRGAVPDDYNFLMDACSFDWRGITGGVRGRRLPQGRLNQRLPGHPELVTLQSHQPLVRGSRPVWNVSMASASAITQHAAFGCRVRTCSST